VIELNHRKEVTKPRLNLVTDTKLRCRVERWKPFKREVKEMIRTHKLPNNVDYVGTKDGFDYFVSRIDGTIYEVKRG